MHLPNIDSQQLTDRSADEDGPRPAFLVGCGRSGTNMITRRLARSPEVELFNEDHQDAFEKYRLRDLATIENLVSRSQARIVLFKPILDTHLTLRLLKHFPRSRVLFAFRHYRDVINSSVRRFGPDKWKKSVKHWIRSDFDKFAVAPPPEATKRRVATHWRPDLSPESSIALYWLFYNGLYLDLELNFDKRVKRVGYESVVAAPQEEFEATCRFLSIGFSPGMIDGIFTSSIGRDDAPVIDRTIELDCETLWQRLTS